VAAVLSAGLTIAATDDSIERPEAKSLCAIEDAADARGSFAEEAT
jgi:hypothetical protein